MKYVYHGNENFYRLPGLQCVRYMPWWIYAKISNRRSSVYAALHLRKFWSLSQSCVTLASCICAPFPWTPIISGQIMTVFQKIINVGLMVCVDVCPLFDEVHPPFSFMRASADTRHSMGLSSFKFFVVDSERRIFSTTECVSAIQGHPRSLILVPIERAYEIRRRIG